MPKIELETIVDAPIEVCFDLSRSIDLHQITTAKTNERAIAGTTKGLIGLNEQVTWQATHFGVRQKLTSNITAYDRPFYFRDEQLKGAFKSFYHEHIFEEQDGKVLMKDIFQFESPFGIFGHIFNKLILTEYMKDFLLERNLVIKDYAESGKWRSLLVE